MSPVNPRGSATDVRRGRSATRQSPKSARKKRAGQLEFRFRTHGGKRRGAGRKKRSTETVPHIRRPKHSRHNGLHLTLRIENGLPSLRGARLFRGVRRALAMGKERFDFRLTSYSVQSDHVHIVAEAMNKEALTRGMRGLGVRIARAVNRVLGRRGRVIRERYHSRPLRSPREIRRTLLYVLRNEHHHERMRGIHLAPWHYDRCSSVLEFDGFALHPELPPPPLIDRETTVAPRLSFILRRGWLRHGRIRLTEFPS